MTEAEVRYIKRLPRQLDAARAKVRAYENAAKRYGMFDLLSDPKHVDKAWDEAIDEGRATNGYPDVVAGVGE